MHRPAGRQAEKQMWCSRYWENTNLWWDLNSDQHKYIFFPLVKSCFKHAVSVTKETTLGKSMKVMPLEREGMLQLSPPNNLSLYSMCVFVWSTLSRSLIFYAISYSSSPLPFICRLSLPHYLFLSYNTLSLTTSAKGLAGAAHP